MQKIKYRENYYRVDGCSNHGISNGRRGYWGKDNDAIPFYYCEECKKYYIYNSDMKIGYFNKRNGIPIENSVMPIRKKASTGVYVYNQNSIGNPCKCKGKNNDYYPYSGMILDSGEILDVKGRRCTLCNKIFIPNTCSPEVISLLCKDNTSETTQTNPSEEEKTFLESTDYKEKYSVDYFSNITTEDSQFEIVPIDTKHTIANKIASAYTDANILFNPYQYLPWLKMYIDGKKNLLISDEVGLGKTIEAGILIKEEFTENSDARILVVCPAFLREKWYMELKEKFFLDVQVYDGKTSLDAYQNVHILPLSRLKQFIDKQKMFEYSMIIIDEVHYFKNSSSKRYENLSTIIDSLPNAKKVFMSATPINNSGNDYHSIRQLFDSEPDRTNTTKKQAYITLPDRHLKDVYVDLNEEEQRFYDTTDDLNPFSGTIYRHIGASCLYALGKYAFRNDELTSETKEELRASMETLMEDMEIGADSFEYFNVLQEYSLPEVDSKLSALKGIIEKYESGTKIVLFSHYIETVKYLQSSLSGDYDAAYIYANHLSNNIPCKHRKDKFVDAKEWFCKSNTKTTILVCSDTCREGIDLDAAHVLINYDLPFNPSILEQRIGRVDRMSQKNDMDIYNFHVNNTYDDRLHFILSTKLRFINYFAEYGIGNPLNIRESGESELESFIRYFKRINTKNESALMSNDDFSTASRLLRKIGIKVSVSDKMSALKMQKYLVSLLEKHEEKIVEWFSKGELQQLTDEELFRQRDALEAILNFPKIVRRRVVIGDETRAAIVKKANATVSFRKRIAGLIRDYDLKLAEMEMTGDPMVVEIEDINNTYDFGTGKLFIPKSVIELMRNEGAEVYEI